jgi:hypothetical protein
MSCAGAIRHSKNARFAKAEISRTIRRWRADDDVIEKCELEQTGGFGDAECESAVGFARGWIAAGMIVCEDECVGAVEDGWAENFAWMREAFI